MVGVLVFSAPWLYVTDPSPSQIDAVLVLSGAMDRMPAGIARYRALRAHYLLLSGGQQPPDPSWGQMMLAIALRAGVPKNACVVNDQAHSTHSNFSTMLPPIQARNIHRVVVVTSWYHTRRSRWVARHFAHQAKDLQFYITASEPVPPPRKRFGRTELKHIGNEWLKLLWYGLRHRLYFQNV